MPFGGTIILLFTLISRLAVKCVMSAMGGLCNAT